MIGLSIGSGYHLATDFQNRLQTHVLEALPQLVVQNELHRSVRITKNDKFFQAETEKGNIFLDETGPLDRNQTSE